MRHGATLVAALDGLSRPAFRIAKELCRNSRSGLTVRFLSKKLELPREEIEYLIDVNDRLFFFDLTKVKIVPAGVTAVARISDGLENRGDVASLFRRIKGLRPHDFRRLEEQIGIERPGPKKGAAETLVARHFKHPDSVVEFVATRGFSSIARDLFDIVWQAEDGVLSASCLRATHGGSEYEVEQGLWELIQGCALFEMFRFDGEDRLVRVVGLLSEIRQWREAAAGAKTAKVALKACKRRPKHADVRGLDLSDRLCRLVAAIAAKPGRLRSDGDLFREDRRRLGELCPEGADPSLNTCLWMAQGVGWLARVDNELRAAELQSLIDLDRIGRHRVLADWLMAGGNEAASRRLVAGLLDDLKPGAWYRVVDFVEYAMRAGSENEQPVLKSSGGHWRYADPGTTGSMDRGLARSLEETLLWLGFVDRAEQEGDSLFRLSELGRCMLSGEGVEKLAGAFPQKQAEIVVQPNFDIIVPGQDVDPLVAVPLEQFAVRASSSQAAVYTLTKDSFTKAVQEGQDGSAFVEFLLRHNRGGSLPSNIMTTLDDWRGGIKHVRLRTLYVLEADDPLIVADLLHRRRFRKYLCAVDPHRVVAYSKISKADLTRGLEREGFVVG